MSNESKHSRDPDTIRDLPKPKQQLRDTVPEQVGVYVGPRPLAPTSDHRTIQIKPVLLASHLDPRRAPTELRLSVPPPLKRPSHGWLIPLGLVAIAAGALLASRWNVEKPSTSTQVPAEPASAAAAAPAPDTAEPSNAPALPASPPGALTSNALPANERSAPPEIAFTSLPTAPPPASAPPRKKKRDPWLE
jgi:hypothetical protein